MAREPDGQGSMVTWFMVAAYLALMIFCLRAGLNRQDTTYECFSWKEAKGCQRTR